MRQIPRKIERQKNESNILNDSFLDLNNIIFKKYKPIKVIGEGSFGKIYSTIRIQDKNVFAMKTEKRNALKKNLETEAYFLFILQGFGIPKLITFGHNKNYNILIEQLLDKTLYDIFLRNNKKCNLANICLIALQLIERLEFIHSKNIVFRDVKPENFMIGIEDPSVIYVIDFGLCKKYRSSKTGKHILPRDTKIFNGTLRYSSSNVVKGKESSRRDDLISLGYVLIFLYKRELPWPTNFSGLNKKTYAELVRSKETNHNGQLFKDIPKEIEEYIIYTQKLKFEETPNYEYMKGLFKQLLDRIDSNIDKVNFCWIDKSDKNSKRTKIHHSRRKSNSRIRILENLEKESIRHQTKDKNKVTHKNFYSTNNFENYDLHQKINSNLLNEHSKIKEKKEEINRQLNRNDYINDENKRIPKINFNKIVFVKNQNKSPKNNNLLINKRNIKLKTDKTINTNQNIYINNNNAIFLNLEHLRNQTLNNEELINKINNRKLINNFVLNRNNNDIKGGHTSKIYNFNIITENENKFINNRHIKYQSFFPKNQIETNNNYLHNNKLKEYKSKIKNETKNDYTYNTNINNIQKTERGNENNNNNNELRFKKIPLIRHQKHNASYIYNNTDNFRNINFNNIK